MRVEVKDLAEFDVHPDGRSVTLHVVDANGTPVAIDFNVAQLGALAITLPNLIETAVRRQYGDGGCRFTYPLEAWTIEQALEPSLFIVTLKTTDGFGISFSLSRRKADELAESIAIATQKEIELTTH